jgi:hypothetical protein
MALKLEDIFSGKRVRAGEEQHEAFVDDFTVISVERTVVGMPWRRFPTA